MGDRPPTHTKSKLVRTLSAHPKKTPKKSQKSTVDLAITAASTAIVEVVLSAAAGLQLSVVSSEGVSNPPTAFQRQPRRQRRPRYTTRETRSGPVVMDAGEAGVIDFDVFFWY